MEPEHDVESGNPSYTTACSDNWLPLPLPSQFHTHTRTHILASSAALLWIMHNYCLFFFRNIVDSQHCVPRRLWCVLSDQCCGGNSNHTESEIITVCVKLNRSVYFSELWIQFEENWYLNEFITKQNSRSNLNEGNIIIVNAYLTTP